MLDVRKIRLILELRESGISDSKVLSAIEKIPREIFIPKNFRNQAYENIALPIGDDQTISDCQGRMYSGRGKQDHAREQNGKASHRECSQ